LDCKEERCQAAIKAAPGSADHLCEDCADHFSEVRGLLDLLGLDYEIDPRLVRGIDYYTRTVFELMSVDLGSQDTLLGGGRYDKLVETFGGPPTPGLGFAGGFERLVLILQERADAKLAEQSLDLFLATLGTEGRCYAFALAEKLRSNGLSVDIDHRGRALRKQLTLANQLRARHLLVIGEDEAVSKSGKIKQMDSGEETEIPLAAESLIDFLRKGV
ncbi:MAG: ATP phosphoribosyltransferase regulatory subunit, partial [Candidatus Bipolaricaulota bacterium]